MKPTEQTEHKTRFEHYMREAGYVVKDAVSYSALAQDIILNLPLGANISSKADAATVKARLKCTNDIRDLAAGRMSPIYGDAQRSGQMRDLAIEVAALLNVPVEHLFEYALADVNLDHGNDYNCFPQVGMKAGHDQDRGLIARDVLKLCDVLSDDERELFGAFYIEGLNTQEMMKRFECTSTRLAINIGRMNAKLKHSAGNDDLFPSHSSEMAEYFYGYDPRPKIVPMSRSLAGEFYRASFRASFQVDNPAVQAMAQRAKTVFVTSSLRMKPEGERLVDVTPQELVQVLEAFSIAKDKPTACLINAWANTFADLRQSYTSMHMDGYFMAGHVVKAREVIQLIKDRLQPDFEDKSGRLAAYVLSPDDDAHRIVVACDHLTRELKF